MAPPKHSRAALLALLLAAACIWKPAAAAPGAVLQQEQRHSAAPPLPPPLASLACSLAGGWCPGDDAAPQPRLPRARCADGSSSCSSGNGTDPGLQPQPHKPLWPLSLADLVGLGAAAAALLLAASGGLGGGAILVPIYLMVLGACFS